MSIKHEEAAREALRILEAAGLGPDSTEPTVREAARDLAVYVNSRTIRAEREAEDAKVRAFLDAMQAEHADPYEEITEGDRSYYRAARKFFEES